MKSRAETEVVVIGGGATGTGVLRDLVMRGIKAILVEQEDLAHGTSSRFHGLLHSGARYALQDNQAARECSEENQILQRIAPNCIKPVGGLFVQLPEDKPDYAKTWLMGCRQAGIKTEEISVGSLHQDYPMLSPSIVKAFKVPDCAVDGFRLIWGNVHSARRYGADILTYSRVTAILQANGRVTGVEVSNSLSGVKQVIPCQMVVNAAGAWAGEVAALAGLKLSVIKDKGTLLAFNQRLFNQVINRLHPPGDGDIFVPHGTITIFGTTSATVEDAECTVPTAKEVEQMLSIGRQIVPALDEYRLIRAFAGVRPLYQTADAANGRSVTRNFSLIDHQIGQGLQGLVSIVGGKFTTYRLMAEKTVDLVAERLNVNAPCRTALELLTEPVPKQLIERGNKVFGFPAGQKAAERLGDSFAKVVEAAEQDLEQQRMFCECELVSLAELKHVLQDGTIHTLGGLRRKTRLGMGTCQGTYCGYRTLGVLSPYPQFAGNHKIYLQEFLQKRWKGIRPVLWGQQLREAQLSTGIYSTLFAMERMT